MDVDKGGDLAPARRWRILAPVAAAVLAAGVVVLVVEIRPSHKNAATRQPYVAATPNTRLKGAVPKAPLVEATLTQPAPGGGTTPCGADRKAALTVYNSDGSQRWSVPQVPGDDQSYPLTDHRVVYAGSGGVVTAYRTSDGVKLWDREVGKVVYALWLTDGSLIVNVDQVPEDTKPRIIALDPSSGSVRWTYDVPGTGFLGDAQLTGDGGLAFLVAGTESVVVLDLTSGKGRWSNASSDGMDPVSTGDGLVFGFGAGQTMVAWDSRTGVTRWTASGVSGGSVVVHGDVGVVIPNAIGAPPTEVNAYDLKTGAVAWRHTFGYIPRVFADPSGFVLGDDWKLTWSLVDADTGHEVWTAHLKSSLDFYHSLALGQDGLLVLEENTVALVDHQSGSIRQLEVPGGLETLTGTESDAYIVSWDRVVRVSGQRVVWSSRLPHSPRGNAAVALDGGVAVQTLDAACAIAS